MRLVPIPATPGGALDAAAALGLADMAHTLPQHGASTCILGKLGFGLLGPIEHPEVGTVWKWRRAPAPHP